MNQQIYLLPEIILTFMPFIFLFTIGAYIFTKGIKDEDELTKIINNSNQSHSDKRILHSSILKEKKLNFAEKQNAKLNLLGVNYKFEFLVSISLALFILGSLISKSLFKAGPVLMVYLGAILSCLVFVKINGLIEKKKDELTIEFLEKLRDITSYLSIGKSLGNAIDDVLRTGHISPVMAREFEAVKVDMRTGRMIHEAFYAMYQRLSINEIRIFAQTIKVFEETGGNLIEIMKSQDAFFTSKIETKNAQKVFISELKTSQKFIVGIPLIMVIGVFIINPSFFGDFYGTGMGQIIAIIAISLLLIGLYCSNSLAKLK